VIQVTNLSMQYGPVVALHAATFRVERGEVVGLLGPNGAGKSTTMKILTTYLYPSAGTAIVGGKSILTEPLEVRKLIGYLPEILPLYPDMEVRRYLEFVGRARGLRATWLTQRLAWVSEHCGLHAVYRKLIRELSKGYRQRVGLAQALIHDPEVIILDEPTSGLDPHQIQEMRHLIRQLAVDKTVLLSTHILQEVEAVADRIVIINNSRIVGHGALPELQHLARGAARVRLAVAALREDVEVALQTLPQVTAIRFISQDDGFCHFEIDGKPGNHLDRDIGALMHHHAWQVGELVANLPSLEETFLALTLAEPERTNPGV
jgi:ABC-2 type transport system ATP-binding protein